MGFAIFLIFFALLGKSEVSHGIKFSAESFAEISHLAKKGKSHLESLQEKANVPQFGPCWKNAISDLQIGCKFLSENVQSDLALRFTDCFLQMSGHEPLACDSPKSICLKKLSDRAFNAYTEFYTHTQSICYFLQSQVWHEETEKTIDKLSSASFTMSRKLEEANEIQESLLHQQKESLKLQYDLNNSSRNVASVLESSRDKVNAFMKDFQVTASEQKDLLVGLFDNLVTFRAWAVNELSWFSSTVYFATVILIAFLFTSVSRTSEARMILFIIFAFNYVFERLLTSAFLNQIFLGGYFPLSEDSLNSWIWLCRKFCICLGIIMLLYTAFSYYDYNVRNHKLLLEIRDQNLKILNHFAVEGRKGSIMSGNNSEIASNAFNQFYVSPKSCNSTTSKIHVSQSRLYNSNLQTDVSKVFEGRNYFSRDAVDSEESQPSENVTVTYEKENVSKEPKSSYNLRSHKSRGTFIDS